MKRLIAAVSFAALAVPAVAVEVGAPYEELNIDRALPQVAENAMTPYVRDASAPFEQTTLDRVLPALPPENIQLADATSASSTRLDVGIATVTPAEPLRVNSPWTNDHNFIAPAQ
jgi:hypothetical protein